MLKNCGAVRLAAGHGAGGIATMQMRERFGQIPAGLQARIEAADGAALDRLLARLPSITTIEEAAAALN
jgi:hypothetical protein